MQVHVLTNLSDPFPEKIVRERLPEGSAFSGEELLSLVWGYGALGFSISGVTAAFLGTGAMVVFSLFRVFFILFLYRSRSYGQ